MRKLKPDRRKSSASVRAVQNQDTLWTIIGCLATLGAVWVTFYIGLLILRWTSLPSEQREGSLVGYFAGIALAWGLAGLTWFLARRRGTHAAH